MVEEDRRTVIQVLDEMYLPEFLSLDHDGDYSKDSAVFTFHPNEPQVVRHSLEYLTPRGLHLCLSQASYCLYEHLVGEEKTPFDLTAAREIYFNMRLRIKKISMDFRREMRLDEFQGRLDLGRVRVGDPCIARMSFDMGNRAICGDLLIVISPNPIPPTNGYAIRD